MTKFNESRRYLLIEEADPATGAKTAIEIPSAPGGVGAASEDLPMIGVHAEVAGGSITASSILVEIQPGSTKGDTPTTATKWSTGATVTPVTADAAGQTAECVAMGRYRINVATWTGSGGTLRVWLFT